MKGIVALQMLKLIEEETGQRIHELFDFICGVSQGAILASFLGYHKNLSITEIEEIYKNVGSKMFTQSLIEGTLGIVKTHSYYDTKKYEDILKNYVGTFVMSDISRNLQPVPKVAIISSEVSEHTLINSSNSINSFVFRSYELPYRRYSSYNGSNKYPIWAGRSKF